MKIDIKKLLLAGTAICAIGAAPMMISQAHAADEFSVDADDSGVFDADELASDVFGWGGNTDGTGAAAEATDSHDLQVNASGTVTVADTDVIGDGTATVAAITAGADAQTLTIDDAANDDASEAVTIDGNISVGAFTSLNLTITGEDTDATGDTLDLDILGDINLGTGTLTITADGGNANNNVDVLVTGNITAGSIALSGANSTVALALAGTAIQTVTGAITGDGLVTVDNAAGAIFAGAVTADTITVEKTGGDSTALFQDAVTANVVLGGDGAAGTNTASFDGTNAGYTVTGTVTGTAGETNNVVVIGGNDILTTAAWGAGGNLNDISLTGTGTSLTTVDTIEAATITVGAGTTLTTGGIATGAVNLSGAGTVALGNTFGVIGTIDNTSGTAGVGTLTGTGAGTTDVSGNVGATNSLASISYDGIGTFDFDGTVAATTITNASTGNLDFADDVTGNVNFAADGGLLLADGADITGAVNNTSGADSAGNITIAGSSVISGAVGSTNTLNTIAVNGVGTASFGSTVMADTIEFGGAATINFADDVTSVTGIDFDSNAGTANFADNADLTGLISGPGAFGTVNFAGTSSVSGAITAADVNFNGGAGETVTLGGAVAATNIDIDGVGSVQANGDLTGAVNFGADGTLNLADGGDVTGAITATTLGEGSFILDGNGDIDAFGTDGNELGVFTVSGTGNAVGVGGNFEAANINNIGGNVVNVGAFTVDVDTGQTLNFDITGATSAGQITSAGVVTIAADAIVNIDVATGDAIVDGQQFTVVDGTGGAGVAALTTTITDNSFLVDFTQDLASTEDLVFDAVVATAASAGTSTNNAEVGGVFDAIGTSANTELALVQQNLASASTQAAVNEVLEATLPTVDNGVAVAIVGASNTSVNMIGTRLAEIRDDKVGSGMFAGNGMYGTQMWGQFFGSSATQDDRGGIAGYDSTTYGLAVGIDTADRLDGVTFGVAGSYASTDIDSENANRTETEVDSWQITAYGDYDLSKTAFLNAMVGYAYNDIESKRFNVGGVSGLTATGDNDGNQYVARVEVGNDYYMKDMNGMILTPTALVNYIHVTQDDYTETGAGGANLEVDPDDINILELGLGVEASWKKQMSNGGLFEPAVHIGYRYDVIGDEAGATSNFTGGGAAFNTDGFDPAESTFNAGFGATVYNTNNWEFTGGYDFEYKSDYAAHSGLVKAKYKF